MPGGEVLGANALAQRLVAHLDNAGGDVEQDQNPGPGFRLFQGLAGRQQEDRSQDAVSQGAEDAWKSRQAAGSTAVTPVRPDGIAGESEKNDTEHEYPECAYPARVGHFVSKNGVSRLTIEQDGDDASRLRLEGEKEGDCHVGNDAQKGGKHRMEPTRRSAVAQETPDHVEQEGNEVQPQTGHDQHSDNPNEKTTPAERGGDRVTERRQHRQQNGQRGQDEQYQAARADTEHRPWRIDRPLLAHKHPDQVNKRRQKCRDQKDQQPNQCAEV